MIRLLDGPGAGAVLAVRRAPLFLRVVLNAAESTTDALDQLDDEPRPQELVVVYRRVTEAAHVHLLGGAASGWYATGDYEHLPDVDGEELRETGAWRGWCGAQIVEPGTLVWRWSTVRDPCRPFEVEHGRWGKPRTIRHPLAGRVGWPVRELARGGNGARLLEFVADGLRVVAPFYSVARA